MKIGGLQKMSLIDYPGRISAVLFAQGCNFRCPYCHNPELVDPRRYGRTLPEAEVLAFLERRRGKLDAVTFSGGEPTLQPDLPSLAGRVKKLGFRVKIDTNGSRPDMLKNLLRENLVDYIAMDIKAPLERYRRIARRAVAPAVIRRSIECIMASGIDYEFRTTVAQSLFQAADAEGIAALISGARLFVLQGFSLAKHLDEHFAEEPPFPRHELERIRRQMQKILFRVEVR